MSRARQQLHHLGSDTLRKPSCANLVEKVCGELTAMRRREAGNKHDIVEADGCAVAVRARGEKRRQMLRKNEAQDIVMLGARRLRKAVALAIGFPIAAATGHASYLTMPAARAAAPSSNAFGS